MVSEQYRQIPDCYYESSLVTIVPFSLPLQRFKEAINGLADAGWSVIESDLSNLSNLFCLMCSFLNFLCQFLEVIKLGNNNNYETCSCSMICLYAFLRYQILVFAIFQLNSTNFNDDQLLSDARSQHAILKSTLNIFNHASWIELIFSSVLFILFCSFLGSVCKSRVFSIKAPTSNYTAL